MKKKRLERELEAVHYLLKQANRRIDEVERDLDMAHLSRQSDVRAICCLAEMWRDVAHRYRDATLLENEPCGEEWPAMEEAQEAFNEAVGRWSKR